MNHILGFPPSPKLGMTSDPGQVIFDFGASLASISSTQDLWANSCSLGSIIHQGVGGGGSECIGSQKEGEDSPEQSDIIWRNLSLSPGNRAQAWVGPSPIRQQQGLGAVLVVEIEACSAGAQGLAILSPTGPAT